MTSLYRRANPAQKLLLRMIEGAVKNACDAHPSHDRLPETFARSIAKRAAGTISAQLPELLAAMPSDRGDSHLVKDAPAKAQPVKPSQRGAVTGSNRRSPLNLIHKRLGLMAGWARKAGHGDRASALADALRVVATIKREMIE